MGRPPGARNKSSRTTTTADREPETVADQAESKGELAHFEPARLPFHPAIEDRFGVDKGQWKVLVEAIYPAAKTADAVVMVLSYCKARKLDPLKRPVHIVPMWDSQRGAYVETVWPGISELRTTASRTKGYAGVDEAEFGDTVTSEFEGRVKRNGNFVNEKVEVDHPEWCRLTVYRMVDGQRCKFVGPKVRWLETYAAQGNTDLPNKMWQKRTEGQLEKCAEAAALRRAFPEELGNELTAEEMIGRDLHAIAGEVVHASITDAAPATAASRDTAPPREIPPPRQEVLPPEVESAEEVQDGNPPPRQAKAAPPKEDPISSGPPRTVPQQGEKAAAAQKAAQSPDDSPKPHRVSGNGLSVEEWADKYMDLLKTSPDMATFYKWIDENTKPFRLPTDAEDAPMRPGPLTRVEKAKPSVYADIRKVTEKTQEKLRDAQQKAQEKAAKKAETAKPPKGEMDDNGAMDDRPAPGPGKVDTSAPANPEGILKQIDAELGAVEDPEQLQSVWDTAVEPMLKDLFPPDQDEAQAIFDKHSRRLGGD